ncbi:MAG TPA: hypothetical protein VGQ55_01000, partial [Pyrinomonadaceae bacterium]|nr:hypothetical protein [Pyrinomonadaceae bacterium]
PPPDDAPIDDLLDYWSFQNGQFRNLSFKPIPSDRTADRILAEVEKDPALATKFLNVFRNSERAGDVLRRIYESGEPLNEGEADIRGSLKDFLKNYTSTFASELERDAHRVSDANEYVTNQEDLLNLTRVDWDRARPMVDQMYRNNEAPVSQVLAKWALYKHALATDSIDVDRYRDELKAIVEDRKATAGMRDLAFDALVSEREWSGRDEWYYTLLADETLADLRVNGSSYTGLTTLIMYSPEDKYVDKMIEFTKSDNVVVRAAAVRNLLIVLSPERPQITRALLPWLSDPKWVNFGQENARERLVTSLATIKMPESVPALIAALDQKELQELRVPVGMPTNADTATRAAWAANAAANAAMTAANTITRASRGSITFSSENVPATSDNSVTYAVNSSAGFRTVNVTTYPLRRAAIGALGFQGDMRAAPALRRMLNLVEEYEKGNVVTALIACKGFTVDEQVNALEGTISEARENPPPTNLAWTAANSGTGYIYRPRAVGGKNDIQSLMALSLMSARTVSDDLVAAVAARIDTLEKSDPLTADGLRKVLQNWDGPAVDALLLRDLKGGKTSSDAIVKLLARRKEISEKLPAAVSELKTGVPAAAGISACMTDSDNDYAAILAGGIGESKAAMLACARLVRGRLPVEQVAPLLRSPDKRLAIAAERYLESEDSPQARAAVLALHPGEAKILGATTAFTTGESGTEEMGDVLELFASVNEYFADKSYFYHEAPNADKEKRLQEEVKKSPDLLGVYAYGDSYIRIYRDRAVFSWEEDVSRYRERALEPAEFDNFKGYLAHNRVDELPPFLGCQAEEECGESKTLLMVGKNGGRRVFVKAPRTPQFFAGLESLFADMKRPAAKLHYWLEKSIPGLEILFADDNLQAETVWKNGVDMRLLVSNKARQKESEKLVEDQIAGLSDEGEDEESEDNLRSRADKLREAHGYDGYSWFAFSSGRLADSISQPETVEYIPMRDGLSPEAVSGQWKARAAGIEVRADETGLYKLAGGKVTKLGTGYYSNPVITPNGRWAVAALAADDEGAKLVRIDLTMGKEYPIDMSGNEGFIRPIAYVPAMARVFVTYPNYEGEYEYRREGPDVNTSGAWLDPLTGRLTPAVGELRPLEQQTFRQLQSAATANEFWSALPSRAKGETLLGIYNTRTQKFTQRLKLPKIEFDSMHVWVDEAEGKAYIVYEGQLLSVPLASQNQQ